MHRLFSIFLFLLAGSHAFAVDFVGRELIIPVVGRTPGAFGSLWQTDLVVSNVAEEGPAVPVTITLTREGQPDMTRTRDIGPQVNVVTRDILQATFELDVAVGMIRVSSTSANARLAARARIYNVGSEAGEFGQSVQGFPITSLAQWVSLPGVSGLDDNRTNVGIANRCEASVKSIAENAVGFVF